MKKYLLITLVGLTTMSFNTSTKEKLKTSNLKSVNQQRETTIRAYVQMRNEWVEGYVFVTNGLVTRCQFPNIQAGGGVQLRAQMYEATKPSFLNPNNPIAVNNNFTHYIDIPNYGRAYFSM